VRVISKLESQATGPETVLNSKRPLTQIKLDETSDKGDLAFSKYFTSSKSYIA
jgi:hypothetical protein